MEKDPQSPSCSVDQVIGSTPLHSTPLRYPVPVNEEARLAELRSLKILDTPREEEFDEIVEIIARVCDCPSAALSLVDSDRQWFKASVNFPCQSTTRDIAFCAHAIRGTEPFVVEDATKDERFKKNPLVTGEPHIRFYAGIPLVTSAGYVIGSLCVNDHVPRTLSDRQRNALVAFGRLVVDRIEARKRLEAYQAVCADLIAQRRMLDRLLVVESVSSDAVYFLDAEGTIDWVNPGFARLTGFASERVLRCSAIDFLFADGGDERQRFASSIEAGRPFRAEMKQFHRDGSEL